MKKNKKVLIIVLVVVILLLLAGAACLMNYKNRMGDGYQAVFLTSGQAYFGKVKCLRADFIELTDVYYLQVNQALQESADSEEQQPNMTLIKLGNELHGPTDMMRINQDHIMFVEDLKEDSQVVQAIGNYQIQE